MSEKHVLVISIDGMANYYLNDPLVRMPHLRRLIQDGAVADGMESVFPSVTWTIHSSLVTGTYPRKHGVIGNWVVDRPNRRVGEFYAEHFGDKPDRLRGETWYDAAKRMGWSTASLCWPVTRGADTLDFNIPEYYDQELFDTGCTASLWEELKAAGLPVERYAEWSNDYALRPLQDWLTAEIAKYVIARHRPGLLQLHFLLPDTYQHKYGIRSKEAYWSLEYVDERIGDLLLTLKKNGLFDKTDVFVVSDHGFVDTVKTFYPNVLFKQRGWLDADDVMGSCVYAVSNGGSGYVYVLEEDAVKRAALLAEVRTLLQAQEGVGRLIEREEFPSLGLPAAGELDEYYPDFAFESEIDCFVHFDHEERDVIKRYSKFIGMHGFLPQREPLKAVFAAAGPSIRAGVRLPEIRIVDVAPTIARLLGTELARADGRALDEIWKEDVRIGNLAAAGS